MGVVFLLVLISRSYKIKGMDAVCSKVSIMGLDINK